MEADMARALASWWLSLLFSVAVAVACGGRGRCQASGCFIAEQQGQGRAGQGGRQVAPQLKTNPLDKDPLCSSGPVKSFFLLKKAGENDRNRITKQLCARSRTSIRIFLNVSCPCN
jgi:hypothetical protein